MKSFAGLTNTEKKLISGGNGCFCSCKKRKKSLEIKTDSDKDYAFSRLANDFLTVGIVRTPVVCEIKCNQANFVESNCASGIPDMSERESIEYKSEKSEYFSAIDFSFSE